LLPVGIVDTYVMKNQNTASLQ